MKKPLPFTTLTRAIAIIALTAVSLSAADRPKTRLAHIGLSLDGSWSWIQQAQQETNAELVAIADPHPDFLARARELVPPSVQLFPDYVPMLDEVKPDAVLVTVPNSQHVDVLRACAQRHIHVWYQKPLAATTEQAREMERLAREAGIILMANYHTLWSKPMQALLARVQAGDIGPVQRLVVAHAFTAEKVLSPSYSGYFLDPALHGGGAIVDQGTYGIDLAVWLLGKPLRVFALGKQLQPRQGLQREDEAWLLLDYPKATALIYAGWWVRPAIGPGVGEVVITGPKGVLRRDLDQVSFVPGDDPARGFRSTGKPDEVPVPVIPAERRHGIAHFIDCIRTGKPVEAPHAPALNVLVHQVVDAAYESIRTGQAVPLP